MTASIGNKLSPYERDQIICLLAIWTPYPESMFEKMSDSELMVEYKGRLGEDFAVE